MRRSECKALPGPIASLSQNASLGLIAALLLSAVLLSLVAGCSGPILTFRAEEPEAGAGGRAEPASTGSIAKPPTSFGKDLDDEDWRRAHAAMSVALDPQGNGRPVKWDNPESAMRGSISPTGLPYVANDEICRDFLASVISAKSSRFIRGTSCRPSGGTWWLKRIRTAKA